MATDPTAKLILDTTRRIALVGASPNPARDSHRVMAYLLKAGFDVMPVNPTVKTVLDQIAYPSVVAIGAPVDTVVCFRRSEEIEAVAHDAIAAGAANLWMQLDVVNDKAREIAEQAGLRVVMNRCIMIDHAALRRAAD